MESPPTGLPARPSIAPTRHRSPDSLRPARQQVGSRSRRRVRLMVAALAVPLVLTGCSFQSLSMSPNLPSSTNASAAPAAHVAALSRTGQPAATQAPSVRGALATGSLAHTLAIGAKSLVVHYWTSQNVATWTSDENVAIQLAAHMQGGDTQHRILLTRFKATVTVDDNAAVTVLADDSGRFVLTPPYSYGSAIVIPAQPAGARAAAVNVQFDLLIETVPGSGQYYRQTVLDSFLLTFIPHSKENSND